MSLSLQLMQERREEAADAASALFTVCVRAGYQVRLLLAPSIMIVCDQLIT